jgi:hypothetical protein
MPRQLSLTAIAVHYAGGHVEEVGAFAPKVLVGVDDIPTRWNVQLQQPHWLGIGATTHWDAMAAYHEQGLACAQCLHPRDDPTTALIPTVAFVSYFAGLLLACYFLVLRLSGVDRVACCEKSDAARGRRVGSLQRRPGLQARLAPLLRSRTPGASPSSLRSGPSRTPWIRDRRSGPSS